MQTKDILTNCIPGNVDSLLNNIFDKHDDFPEISKSTKDGLGAHAVTGWKQLPCQTGCNIAMLLDTHFIN